jgi:hypothetical protein
LAGESEEVQNLPVRLRVGLGDVSGEDDVEDQGKKLFDTQAAQDLLSMGKVAAGEDSFLEGDGLQKIGQRGVGTKLIFDTDVMNVFQVFLRVDALVDHQAAEGRAIVPDVFLSELPGQIFFKTHPDLHVTPDPINHHLKDTQRLWIEGVVQIEEDAF